MVKAAIDSWPGHSFFGVFDGHGGSLVAQYTAEHLLDRIEKVPGIKEYKSNDELKDGLTRAFIDIDAEMRNLPAVKSGEDHSGSTGICAMVTDDYVYMINVGDSRAVLSHVDEKAVWGTEDHKPNNEVEQARIEAAGGSVMNRRVNGDLAVSRAFGDFLYKAREDLPAQQQQVSVEPEISALPRKANAEYLILCCDGIWDVMSNEEVVEFVRSAVAKGEVDLGCVSEMLIDTCLEKGSRDNMSAMIVAMPAAKQPAPSTIEAYRKVKAEREAAEAAARAAEAAAAGR